MGRPPKYQSLSSIFHEDLSLSLKMLMNSLNSSFHHLSLPNEIQGSPLLMRKGG
jgi:hypothetical protein